MHSTSTQNILSELFRSIEADLGAHHFCIMTLEALKSALSQYKIKTHEELLHQLLEVFNMVRQTRPRYAILNDSFYRIIEVVENAQNSKTVAEILEEIERIKVGYQLEMKDLVQTAHQIDVEGKNILIHDHSHSVQNVLKHMKQSGKKFSVLVAEQDMEKTEDNIKFLHEAEIPYKVVPAYMLSHVDETVDMLFFGAVTLQENHHLVMDPGCKSIISHFNLEKKPIYVFLATSKFSLWKLEKPTQEVYAKAHKRKHHTLKEIEFERLKFSHDRVSVNLVDHVVTGKGIFSPQEISDIFDDMFKKRQQVKKKYMLA